MVALARPHRCAVARMIAPIAIRRGDLSGGTAYEDQGPSRRGRTEREGTRAAALSVERGRGAAHSEHTRHGYGRAIFGASGFVAGVSSAAGTGGAGVDMAVPVRHHRVAALRPEFLGAFKASRTLSFGNARVQACKQSSRRIRQAFHVQRSFRAALAFHEQEITKGRPRSWKKQPQTRKAGTCLT